VYDSSLPQKHFPYFRYTGNVLGQQLSSGLFSTIFIGKMTDTGNLVWVKTDGTSNDGSHSIITDKKGSIYLQEPHRVNQISRVRS
jgi:hypothetical protein